VEDDSSERILKPSQRKAHCCSHLEVEDDSSERILKQRDTDDGQQVVGEVEDDSSERILKLQEPRHHRRVRAKWKTILQREY